MQRSNFPGCCGIYVISGFPYDDHRMFQPQENIPGELAKHEVAQAMTLVALTSAQTQAQAQLEAEGYVAVGKSSGIHANGTAITLFAKGMSPMETPKPKRVRVVKTKKTRRKR